MLDFTIIFLSNRHFVTLDKRAKEIERIEIA